jgi:hypothetical protein
MTDKFASLFQPVIPECHYRGSGPKNAETGSKIKGIRANLLPAFAQATLLFILQPVCQKGNRRRIGKNAWKKMLKSREIKGVARGPGLDQEFGQVGGRAS